MVADIAGALARGGFGNVRADAPGFDPPTAIHANGSGASYIPDVLCSTVLVEVETDDTISAGDTGERWCAFGGFARKVGLRFFVGVPSGFEAQAMIRLRELGLDGEVLAL